MKGNWQRVTRSHPCPVCSRTHWCLTASDAVLCMRVASDHPKTLKSGEVGYIHRMTTSTGTTPMRRHEPEPEPVINCQKLWQGWFAKTKENWLMQLATYLGVMTESLHSLGAAWAHEHNAWCFPMSDGFGNIIGLRLRSGSGRKWAVRGSHQGIFIPCLPQATALVTEGPTDTCAALSLGYYAVGRPSCSGGAPHLRALFKRICIRRAVIISDNDDPGLNGATMLSKHLGVSSCILVPPAKDLRAYLNAGGDKATLDSMIKGQVWSQCSSI